MTEQTWSSKVKEVAQDVTAALTPETTPDASHGSNTTDVTHDVQQVAADTTTKADDTKHDVQQVAADTTTKADDTKTKAEDTETKAEGDGLHGDSTFL